MSAQFENASRRVRRPVRARPGPRHGAIFLLGTEVSSVSKPSARHAANDSRSRLFAQQGVVRVPITKPAAARTPLQRTRSKQTPHCLYTRAWSRIKPTGHAADQSVIARVVWCLGSVTGQVSLIIDEKDQWQATRGTIAPRRHYRLLPTADSFVPAPPSPTIGTIERNRQRAVPEPIHTRAYRPLATFR
jgi:hypothetical protein